MRETREGKKREAIVKDRVGGEEAEKERKRGRGLRFQQSRLNLFSSITGVPVEFSECIISQNADSSLSG